MRRPSEKLTLRLYPKQAETLLALLNHEEHMADADGKMRARIITNVVEAAVLQHRIKESEWERAEEAECPA